jgi:hypothetical protein
MPATFYDVLAVLAPPGGAHGVGEGIFGFLGMGAACPLRLVSKVLVRPCGRRCAPPPPPPLFHFNPSFIPI